ncbi:hypothetical protein Slala04_06800 [Streptomyces lavendulae subsp. lavendulae]|nr:hypothetical protein Slala04_06800 [Streptomyces lavendulae subsp. lavendulae]
MPDKEPRHEGAAVEPSGPTLFQTLINQRGWQDYQVFKRRYEQAAKQLAELEGPSSIATATIEKRQFFRYARGPDPTDRRPPRPGVHVSGHPGHPNPRACGVQAGPFPTPPSG